MNLMCVYIFFFPMFRVTLPSVSHLLIYATPNGGKQQCKSRISSDSNLLKDSDCVDENYPRSCNSQR
jgi:hypothetical protein